MRFLRIGMLCLCALVVATSGSRAETDSKFASEFSVAVENLQKDKETAKWVDKVLYDLVRHGLDRKTAEVLAQDAFVKDNRLLIDETMRRLGDYGRNMMRSRGAESAYADKQAGIPGQYASVRNAAQKLAKFFNFSKEMRSNLNVFVLDSPAVNAFAYGSFDTIEIALFTGLIEKLNKAGADITEVNDMVKSVIAHELAHVKNKHVEQMLIVISIFFSRHKNVIPAAMQEKVTALMKDQVMRSLYSIDPQQALASEQSELYRGLFDHSWEVIQSLAEELHHRAGSAPEKFEALITELAQNFAAYDVMGVLTDAQIEGEAAEVRNTLSEMSQAEAQAAQKLLARYGLEVRASELMDTTIPSEMSAEDAAQRSGFFGFIRELFEFLRALQKLSRSHEVTSDRFAQIATSEKTMQRKFARFGGGRDASPEAMMRQAEQWALDLSKDPSLQKIINESMMQSHPVILMRIYQTMLFSESAALKVHQLPMYKALTLYMEGIKMVEASEQVMEGKTGYGYRQNAVGSVADGKEAYELYLETEKATPFKEIVQKFGEIIADSIIAADAKSEKDLNMVKFAELVDYLQSLKKDRGDSAIPKKRLSVPGTEQKLEGLLYTLNFRLRHLDVPAQSDGHKAVQEALALIRPFQPVGSTWELNKETGTWVQKETTSADTERRRLEDFRRRARETEASKTAAKKAAEAAKRKR